MSTQYIPPGRVSVDQVAAHFKVTKQCVSKWIRYGLLECEHFMGRYLIRMSVLKKFKPPNPGKIGRPKKSGK